ncbi:UNVERIFIED_CONTAM: hypothetical protein GTU68_049305, partial [Idotea baltica]|nr:hypothetical protein [Idotea baltica]
IASVLAHEVRNPLSSINGATQLLRGSISEDDQDLLDVIVEESKRIEKLIGAFEEVGGEGRRELCPVNIHKILDNVRRSAQAGYAQGIKIEINFDPSLPRVMCDEDEMIRAIHNLIKNAAEAIRTHHVNQIERGKILLSTRFRPGVRKEGSAQSIEISIHDNGGGIPVSIRKDIFTPFVTSKKLGTGLGLSVVASAIESIGGAINFENKGEGTLVRIFAQQEKTVRGNY